MVPMTDGVKLATDLYFPEGAGDKLPVVLIRTPYDKNAWRPERSPAHIFAGQGYIVAIQDVRGKFESEGNYIVSAADAKDGFDMVNWATVQPWSSGKVGTYGCSYLGENQMEMARLQSQSRDHDSAGVLAARATTLLVTSMAHLNCQAVWDGSEAAEANFPARIWLHRPCRRLTFAAYGALSLCST